MIDINRWYECRYEKPKKRGKYLLLVGIRNKQTGHTDIGVIESFWNGQSWATKDSYALLKWKYIKPGEIDKYPDFEKNNRRISIND